MNSPHPAANASVDAPLRGPLLFLFALALAGFAAGTALELAAALSLFAPDLAGQAAFLGYGRLAALAAPWTAGSAVLGGLAGGLWILARVGGRPPSLPGFVPVLAGGFWSAGLLVSALAPGAGAPLQLAGAALFALAAFSLFAGRATERLHPSQAYLLAAFAALPLFLGVAAAWGGDPGVTGPLVAAWSAAGIAQLALGSCGLAAACYLFPRIAGRPLHSRGLAFFAFWVLAAFGGWAGGTALLGGPFPAWFLSAGTAARLLLPLAALAAAVNLYQTARADDGSLPWRSPAFRFLGLGLLFFLLWNGDAALRSLRAVSAVVHFTWWETGADVVLVHGFACFSFLGVLYYAGPRLARWEWSSPRLVSWHFWLLVLGIGLQAGALATGGLIEGLGLLDPHVPFPAVADAALPFLAARAAALALSLAGQGIFALLFVRLARQTGPLREGPAWLEETA